jgi:Fe-S oxidoreductase/FAD/FMN-containing dehydrogenase
MATEARGEMNLSKLEKGLREIVGDRVTTSEFERWFYRSDMAPIPSELKILFKTMPSAVVRPVTTEEISRVAVYCNERGIPMVPRAGGSSGLLGSVPKKGGIVIDLLGLSGVTEINGDRKTVVAETGITWWDLDKRLRKRGLATKSYPSSAKSATVGGWAMTSGDGIGSLKYGRVYDQIPWAELVLPDGSIREFPRGGGLDEFFQSEGILGIMTKAEIHVRDIPEAASRHLISFERIESLFEAAGILASIEPKPYSIEIFDGRYLNLVKASGYRTPDFEGGSGFALVAFEGEREEVQEGRRKLGELLGAIKGEEREGAEEEWEQRLFLFRVRRAAPTIMLSDAVIPIDKGREFYSGLDRLRKRTMGLVGHITSPEEITFLPMYVTDERKLVEFVFSLHTPREIADLALEVGGYPGGGLGVWNAPYRNRVLSSEELGKKRQKKRALDPKNIMNPGMWIDPPIILSPTLYRLGTSTLAFIDRVLPGRTEAIGEVTYKDFVEEARACVQCGYCVNVCPTSQGWLSSTPRGKLLAIKNSFLDRSYNRREITQEFVSRVYECTMCGRCEEDCTVKIRSPELWGSLRSYLQRRGFSLDPIEGLVNVLIEHRNIAAKSLERQVDWLRRTKLSFDPAEKKKAKAVYFVGCNTAYFAMAYPIAQSFVHILDLMGIDFVTMGGEEWCCGFPFIVAGKPDESREFILHNIEKVKELGADTVFVSCPGCYRVWSDEYRKIIQDDHGLDVVHTSQFLAGAIEEGRIRLNEMEERVTYHDPCDLGRNAGVYDEPRSVIRGIPRVDFVELEDRREYAMCCGAGGDLLAVNLKLSQGVSKRRAEQVIESGAQVLITACPSCVKMLGFGIRELDAEVSVMDICQLVYQAMEKPS